MRKVIAGIYCFNNLVNSKRYIGSSKDVLRRKEEHLACLRENVHCNKHLQNAWNLYGEENLVFEILEPVPRLENESKKDFKKRLVNDREQYYLDTLLFASENDNRFNELGYNILRKADSPLGLKRSEEAKAKRAQTIIDFPEATDSISIPVLCYDLQGNFIQKFKSTREAVRILQVDGSGIIQCRQGKVKRFKQFIFKPFEENYLLQIEPYKLSLKDKKRPREIVDKVAASNRGKKRTEEQRYRCGNGNRGRKQSLIERKKRSESHKLRNKLHPRSEEHIRKNAEAQYIPIVQFDLQGNFLAEFPSLKHAAAAIRVGRGSICSVAKGRQKTCKGYIFKYKEISDNNIKTI